MRKKELILWQIFFFLTWISVCVQNQINSAETKILCGWMRKDNIVERIIVKYNSERGFILLHVPTVSRYEIIKLRKWRGGGKRSFEAVWPNERNGNEILCGFDLNHFFFFFCKFSLKNFSICCGKTWNGRCWNWNFYELEAYPYFLSLYSPIPPVFMYLTW